MRSTGAGLAPSQGNTARGAWPEPNHSPSAGWLVPAPIELGWNAPTPCSTCQGSEQGFLQTRIACQERTRAPRPSDDPLLRGTKTRECAGAGPRLGLSISNVDGLHHEEDE